MYLVEVVILSKSYPNAITGIVVVFIGGVILDSGKIQAKRKMYR